MLKHTFLPKYLLALLIVLAGASSMASAQADDCATRSPNVQMGNDAWTVVPPQQLSMAEMDKVQAFLDKIVGAWKGRGVTTECVMHEGKPESMLIQQSITVSNKRTLEHEFNFAATVFNLQDNVSTGYGFVISNPGELLDLQGEGHIELMSLSPSGVKFRTQSLLMQSGGRGITAHVETVRELSLQQNGNLHFKKSEFHEGVMAVYSDWQLQQN